jgi:hypothetical protein
MASKSLSNLLSTTKTDSRMTSTWKYTPKYTKKEGKNDLKYITNTKIENTSATFSHPIGKQKLSPSSHADAGISKKMGKAMKFNLNMNTGKGGYKENVGKYFDRLYSVYPEHEIDNLCQYVFIVRPDLNIVQDSTNKLVSLGDSRADYLPNSSPDKDQLFRYMKKAYPYILYNLSGTELSGHDFIPYLVGRTESLNLPDYTIKDYKMNQPFTNYNLPYASHALESQTGGQFEITFREDDDFQIHKLFQTWLYYIDGVTRNKFGPKVKYIKDNRIDYACSVYCITCKADATEIVYWTKYTGAFPTSVPNSDLSFNLRGSPNNKVTIPFDYFYTESLNPYILVDFNKNAHVTSNASKQAYIPIYRSGTVSSIGMAESRSKERKAVTKVRDGLGTQFVKSAPVALGSGNALVGAPFVCKIGNKYYLRWKKIKNLTPDT